MKLKKLMMALVAAGIFVGVGAGVKDVRAEVYTYPITSDDPEWSNYKHAELVNMLQIPEDVLTGMSNEELVESVLNYPYIMDIMCYDKIADGIEIVADHFNGLKEVLERDNIADTLIQRYQTVTLDEMKSYDPYEDYEEACKPGIVQLLLAHLNAQNKLNAEEQNRLSSAIKEKIAAVEESGDEDKYGLYSIYTTTYDPPLPPPLYDDSILPYHISSVFTPNGSKVPTIVFELDPMEDDYYANQAIAYVEDKFDTARVINRPSQRYNCHSFAWYSWDTENNNHWINDPSPYWRDGSYKRISNKQVNAIIVYFSNSIAQHSGSIVATGQVMSKWSRYPLVTHDIYDCPYIYDDLELVYYK